MNRTNVTKKSTQMTIPKNVPRPLSTKENVTHCKDCIYCKQTDIDLVCEKHHGRYYDVTTSDWYCALGKSRELNKCENCAAFQCTVFTGEEINWCANRWMSGVVHPQRNGFCVFYEDMEE